MTLTDRKSFDCESCSVSKMTSKASGPPRETRASHPFELIFTDLAGPLDPVGIHGYRYPQSDIFPQDSFPADNFPPGIFSHET